MMCSRHASFVAVPFVCVLFASSLLAAPPTTKPAPATAPANKAGAAGAAAAEIKPDPNAPPDLDLVLLQLMREADQLEPTPNAKVQPTFARPHPMLAKFAGGHQVPKVRQKMVGKLT